MVMQRTAGVDEYGSGLSLLIIGITLIVFVFDKSRPKQHRLVYQKIL